MRTPRNENLILQARDGHRRTVGSIVVRGNQVWMKAWLNFATHERHDSAAMGVNEAVLRHLDDCRVKDVYLLDTASKRIYHTNTQTLRRLGTRHRHVEKGHDFGWNWNLPLVRWDRMPSFNLGYVPAGAEWVIEAVPQSEREDEPAECPQPVATMPEKLPTRSEPAAPAQLGLFDAACVA